MKTINRKEFFAGLKQQFMDEDKEDVIDSYFELKKHPGLGRNIFYQFRLMHILFSNPRQFFKKMGPFLFVNFVMIATLIVIILILTRTR